MPALFQRGQCPDWQRDSSPVSAGTLVYGRSEYSETHKLIKQTARFLQTVTIWKAVKLHLHCPPLLLHLSQVPSHLPAWFSWLAGWQHQHGLCSLSARHVSPYHQSLWSGECLPLLLQSPTLQFYGPTVSWSSAGFPGPKTWQKYLWHWKLDAVH